MTRKRFVKLCMGRLGMSRNEANRVARKRESVSAIERTEAAIIAAEIAFRAMSCAMADLVEALDAIR